MDLSCCDRKEIKRSAAKGTVATTYTTTIIGKYVTSGGCYGLSHSATVTLTVTPELTSAGPSPPSGAVSSTKRGQPQGP